MKRTGERVLGIIGIIMFMLGALMFGVVSLADGEGFFDEILMELADEGSFVYEEGEELAPLTDEELAITTELFESLNFTLYTIAALIAGGAGIAAVVLVSKKPIIASILFLGSAVLYGALAFVTLIIIVPLLPMLLYIIAGIMALVRKPKQVESI